MARLADFAPLPARPALVPSANDPNLAKTNAQLSAYEFVGRAVDFIHSDFGRLVLLHSLQDKTSGAYQGAFAALAFDSEGLDQALLHFQSQTFRSWLSRDRAEKAEDVCRYCRAAGRRAREMAAGWIVHVADYALLVPPSIPEPDRDAFCSDLELALATAYATLP
jgi:hypothetical protein